MRWPSAGPARVACCRQRRVLRRRERGRAPASTGSRCTCAADRARRRRTRAAARSAARWPDCGQRRDRRVRHRRARSLDARRLAFGVAGFEVVEPAGRAAAGCRHEPRRRAGGPARTDGSRTGWRSSGSSATGSRVSYAGRPRHWTIVSAVTPRRAVDSPPVRWTRCGVERGTARAASRSPPRTGRVSTSSEPARRSIAADAPGRADRQPQQQPTGTRHEPRRDARALRRSPAPAAASRRRLRIGHEVSPHYGGLARRATPVPRRTRLRDRQQVAPVGDRAERQRPAAARTARDQRREIGARARARRSSACAGRPSRSRRRERVEQRLLGAPFAARIGVGAARARRRRGTAVPAASTRRSPSRC